jgi:hypothetical protein
MFRHHHISTSIALVLALALAAGPSAAVARPNLDPPAATAANIWPILDPPAATSQTQATPAVNPHSRDAANPAVRAIQAQGARVAHELAARDAATGSATPSPPPLIVKVSPPNGFVWSDAGIGAGATFGLILVLLGSTLYWTHRRTARASQPR